MRFWRRVKVWAARRREEVAPPSVEDRRAMRSALDHLGDVTKELDERTKSRQDRIASIRDDIAEGEADVMSSINRLRRESQA